MLSLFGSMYLFEKTFSVMNLNKSRVRTRLTDSHMWHILCINTIAFEPDLASVLHSRSQNHINGGKSVVIYHMSLNSFFFLLRSKSVNIHFACDMHVSNEPKDILKIVEIKIKRQMWNTEWLVKIWLNILLFYVTSAKVAPRILPHQIWPPLQKVWTPLL